MGPPEGMGLGLYLGYEDNPSGGSRFTLEVQLHAGGVASTAASAGFA